MITLTPDAAKQMLASVKHSDAEGMPLRIAAHRKDDGSFNYGMGFDDQNRDDDVRFTCEGVELVISPESLELLKGTVVDFVELEPGQHHFIFMNPNDPDQNSANQD